MSIISSQEVEKILFSKSDQAIKLNNNYCYYKISHNRKNYITYSKNSVPKKFADDEKYLLGCPIVEIKKNKLVLFPSIMDSLNEDTKIITINDYRVTKVSFGKRISINKKNSFYLIIDKFERRIAMGYIKNKIFNPIVDIGWYLRMGY